MLENRRMSSASTFVEHVEIASQDHVHARGTRRERAARLTGEPWVAHVMRPDGVVELYRSKSTAQNVRHLIANVAQKQPQRWAGTNVQCQFLALIHARVLGFAGGINPVLRTWASIAMELCIHHGTLRTGISYAIVRSNLRTIRQPSNTQQHSTD